ncbi:MAG: phosphoribosyl-AMP cyclohydrolase [Actinomycetota bacterium]|jgi:phosphoribosyl-ATP pyrophosphohydrolase/phosphoribosyl-AMP cyclohydrolase
MSDALSQRLKSGELLPAIVQDLDSKKVLMLAWVNNEAFEATLKNGRATFWSRSRNELWEKGSSSGNFQEIVEIKFDCDADSLLYLVRAHGPACHTGEQSCFYRGIESSK